MNFSKLKDARVLVIGANSFIGSHLVSTLHKVGAVIFATSRFNVLETKDKGITSYSMDIADAESVKKLLVRIKPDFIFNFAGFVQGGRQFENVWPTFETNLKGTVNLLSAVEKVPCKRLILMGSLETAQSDANLIKPRSPYAASKIAAAAYARMFHDLYDLPVVIAKLFMVYGPNQKDHQKLIPYTILSLLKGRTPKFSSGNRKVDWIYIDDVVTGLLHATLCPDLEGQTIQYGTGRLVSIQNVISRIFAIMNAQTRPHFGTLPDRQGEIIVAANIDQSRRLTGWEPKIDLDTGIRKTVDWYAKYYR